MTDTLLAKIKRRVDKARFSPKLGISPHDFKLARLGSRYGGWSFIDSAALRGSTIVSCGLGEDASFDVEFAAAYGAKVVLVDPTPRAIRHFENLKSRLGQPAQCAYAQGGCMPVKSYDLSRLGPDDLVLYEKALWNKPGKLKFFQPLDPNHVSHSIVNFQSHYRTDTGFMEVDAVTLDMLLRELNLACPALMKMDIEGAEVEVILDMLAKNILPDQLLVEYDELAVPSRKSRSRIEGCHQGLLSAGYRLVHVDEPSNFLYTRLR